MGSINGYTNVWNGCHHCFMMYGDWHRKTRAWFTLEHKQVLRFQRVMASRCVWHTRDAFFWSFFRLNRQHRVTKGERLFGCQKAVIRMKSRLMKVLFRFRLRPPDKKQPCDFWWGLTRMKVSRFPLSWIPRVTPATPLINCQLTGNSLSVRKALTRALSAIQCLLKSARKSTTGAFEWVQRQQTKTCQPFRARDCWPPRRSFINKKPFFSPVEWVTFSHVKRLFKTTSRK